MKVSLRILAIVANLIFQVPGVHSQNEPLMFQLLGQDEDMAHLAAWDDKSFYGQLKWIDLGGQNSISFGGGHRFQLESFINENFTPNDGQDNGWVLNRLMAHAHFQFKEQVNIYLELLSGTLYGKRNIGPVDKDVLAFNQAYIRYALGAQWGVIIGRQNLKLGTRRLVDIREGPNVRRSFDLIRFDHSNTVWNLTIFFAVPVVAKAGVFDNVSMAYDETFMGCYFTRLGKSVLNYDLYGFYQKDDGVTYNAGMGNERRATLGSRFFGQWGKLTFNHEFAYQFGRFESLDIHAYTVSIQGEWQGRLMGKKVIYGLKTELISGDRKPGDGCLNTFDALYPRGAYFGKVARFGPSNLIDVHPSVTLEFSKHSIEVDYDVFWRYSRSDGVYNAALQLAYPSLNDRSLIANQLGLLYSLKVNTHTSITLEANMIIPGPYLTHSGFSSTLAHTVLGTEFRF